jgi:hypothetical protein
MYDAQLLAGAPNSDRFLTVVFSSEEARRDVVQSTAGGVDQTGVGDLVGGICAWGNKAIGSPGGGWYHLRNSGPISELLLPEKISGRKDCQLDGGWHHIFGIHTPGKKKRGRQD